MQWETKRLVEVSVHLKLICVNASRSAHRILIPIVRTTMGALVDSRMHSVCATSKYRIVEHYVVFGNALITRVRTGCEECVWVAEEDGTCRPGEAPKSSMLLFSGALRQTYPEIAH